MKTWREVPARIRSEVLKYMRAEMDACRREAARFKQSYAPEAKEAVVYWNEWVKDYRDSIRGLVNATKRKR